MLVKMGSSSPRIRGEHLKKIFELPPPCYFRVFFSGFFVMLGTSVSVSPLDVSWVSWIFPPGRELRGTHKPTNNVDAVPERRQQPTNRRLNVYK